MRTDDSQTFNVRTTNPLDLPFLPYRSFESDLGWTGLQVKDAWSWSSANSLVFGVDYEEVTSVSRRRIMRVRVRMAKQDSDSTP